jgi:ABC-type multidrug transport system fused ATPase/permease subunit
MSNTGVAYNPTNWELTKRLLGYMKPFMLTFIGIVVTAFGRNGIYALIVPIIIMLIIDYILLPVPGKTHWFLELVKSVTGVQTQTGLLAALCILIVALAVIRGLFHITHITLRATLSQKILRVMRKDFYNALIHKSFSYLDRVMSGQIISRVTSDMGAIDLFYSETVREIFRHGMQFLFTFYIMYTLDPHLTLVCCVPLPVIFLFTRLYSSRISGYLARAKNQFGDLSNILVEGITGHKLIVTHGQESHITERFRDENRGYVKTSLDAALIQSLYRPSSAAMLAAGLSLVVYYGGQRVVAGLLTVGEMVLFGMYFTQLVGPVRMFARLIMFYQDALASARRVFEVIDVGEDVPEAEDAVELGDVRGEIVFDGVGFSYGGAETLTDINLRVAPSEKVALMGYVGSGKTTLAELVPRFYDVSAGRVTVDGVDVKKVKLDSLRRNVGIVLQDVYVFGDTIRNNIAFGRPEATVEEVERAARAAQIHEFIAGLPEGYETMIGERGITLSGGQRQRLTIARALITDPRILILDDSTSNVDAETETLIRLAIDELLKGRTALIITQRASTCEAADRVVVMERGRITAVGTHSELLRSSPDYRRLIESQAFQLGGEP